MKEFSLVENDGVQYPDVPKGIVVVFGNKREAVAFTDYDGKTDRSQPSNVDGEWFPLGRDFDSIMAWHGDRKKVKKVEYVRIRWKKEGRQ